MTSVSDQLHPAQGMAIEIILTFVLVFVIFATTDGDRVEYGSASLAIGLTVGLGHLSCVSSRIYPYICHSSCVRSRIYPYIGHLSCVSSRIYPYICHLSCVSCRIHLYRSSVVRK